MYYEFLFSSKTVVLFTNFCNREADNDFIMFGDWGWLFWSEILLWLLMLGKRWGFLLILLLLVLVILSIALIRLTSKSDLSSVVYFKFSDSFFS